MFVVVVVVFALESWMLIRTSRDTLESLVKENLRARTQNVMEQTDRFVTDRCDELRSWSTLNLMDEVLLKDRFLNIENLVLRLYREPHRHYLSLSVLDPAQRIVASSELERIGQVWPASVLDLSPFPDSRTRMGPLSPPGGSGPRSFMLAQPIVSLVDTEPIGWIVAQVDWRPIEAIVRNAPISGRPQDESRFLLLLDSAGRVLAGHPEYLGALPDDMRSGTGIAPAMLGKRRSRAAGSYLVAASGFAGAFSSVGNDVSMMALWRKQDAFAMVPVFLTVVLGSAGLGLALAGAGFIGFSRSITRRLKRLTEGTERLAHGDLRVRVEEIREDEVGRLARSFNTMAGEIARAHDSLESAVARWQGLVTTAPDLIYTVARSGEILFVNRVLPGYEVDRVIGTTIFDYVPEPYHAGLHSALERIFTGETAQSLDVEGPGADGAPAWYSTRLGPVERDGKVIAATLVASDITPRKRLEREIVEVSELERERIGRDLHDGIGQLLTGIGLHGKGLERRLDGKEPETAADARRINDLVKEALEQTRSLSRGLVPIDDSRGGLPLALEDLATSVERTARVACLVHIEGEPDQMDQSRATHLYRIAQEAVSNSLRHGKASRIVVTLRREVGGWRLTIEDDGSGLPPDFESRTGMGLRSMRYRAGVIGATFNVRVRAEGGVVVSCQYP